MVKQLTLPQVITQLVDEFTLIGDERMRELPLYNAALEVEAVDFQQHDDTIIGVLITPWFMNVMLFNKQGDEQAAQQVTLGDRIKHVLPSGEHEFMVGEAASLGRYDFMTLASPMFKFKQQADARVQASQRLKQLLQDVSEAEQMIEEKPVQFVDRNESADSNKGGVNRRSFLRGQYGK